jgi:hypothetical protein
MTRRGIEANLSDVTALRDEVESPEIRRVQ